MRRFLDTGTATPSDIAGALGLPLGTVSYHVRFLADRGIVRLAGRTQRRGAVAHHYQLTDRDRVASLVWGTRAELLVTDFERQNGRGDVTVRLDAQALAELRKLTAAYLARIGELGLQTRERNTADEGGRQRVECRRRPCRRRRRRSGALRMKMIPWKGCGVPWGPGISLLLQSAHLRRAAL